MLRTIRNSFALMLMTAVLPALAFAQISTGISGGAITSGCSGDKVQLTGFTLTPANPTLNQNVTVTVSMKNLCGSTINIPYKVSNYSTNVNSGTKSVPANQTASVQFNWTATQGNHSFDAYLDPGKTLGETSTGTANNGATSLITFTVAPPPPPMETKVLSYSDAQQAGALFNKVHETAVGCIEIRLEPSGVYSFAAALWGPPQTCSSVSYEAFKNLLLKNGWKIKAVAVTPYLNSNSTWEWVNRPADGSSNPYAKIRIKANSTTNPSELLARLLVRITIEGPQGTSPY